MTMRLEQNVPTRHTSAADCLEWKQMIRAYPDAWVIICDCPRLVTYPTQYNGWTGAVRGRH
jgi:hypothetical protein